MFRAILLACCLVLANSSGCNSLPVNQSSEDAIINQVIDLSNSEWDDLKITWSLNPFDTNSFMRVPRTEAEALDQGWTKERNCSQDFLGNRYLLNGDRAVMLLFDWRGNIAGMSAGIPKGLPYIPSAKTKKLFTDEGDFYSISAYFTDPETVCTETKEVTRRTGDRLIFKSQSTRIQVPMEQINLTSFWTPGQCISSMGMHYWSEAEGPVSKITLQNDFLPIFLLYNNGKLNVNN
jgi:hypothetical protein